MSKFLITVCAATSLVALAACSSGSTGASSPSPEVQPSSSAAPSDRSAWVRGTVVKMCNESGGAVSFRSATSHESDKTPFTPVADGSCTTASDAWRTAGSTSVDSWIKFNDAAVLAIEIENPDVGTPNVTAYEESESGTPGPDLLDEEPFSEGDSKSITADGYQVTVARGSDDGDNKNWAVTVG